MWKCDTCGRIISDEEYKNEILSYGGGNCYCEFKDGRRIIHTMRIVKWYEMLDWNEMGDAWNNLSEGIKKEIRDAGFGPDE